MLKIMFNHDYSPTKTFKRFVSLVVKKTLLKLKMKSHDVEIKVGDTK